MIVRTLSKREKSAARRISLGIDSLLSPCQGHYRREESYFSVLPFLLNPAGSLRRMRKALTQDDDEASLRRENEDMVGRSC